MWSYTQNSINNYNQETGTINKLKYYFTVLTIPFPEKKNKILD